MKISTEKINTVLVNVYKNKKPRAIVLWLFLVLCGYLAGSIIGYNAIKQALYNNVATLMFVYRPAYNFIGLYQDLNSPEELKRLAGYYSLKQGGMIDAEYLCDRFEKEQGDVNKRTIVWLLGYSKNKKKVYDIFSRNYRQSSSRIRREMLRSLQRMGNDVFKDFVTEKEIRGEFLEGL